MRIFSHQKDLFKFVAHFIDFKSLQVIYIVDTQKSFTDINVIIQPERALKTEEVHLGDILDERLCYVLLLQFQI